MAILTSSQEVLFMKRKAMEMCEWNGGDYHYGSRELFADSMIKNGLLEYVD
jgi:guanylate kinase